MTSPIKQLKPVSSLTKKGYAHFIELLQNKLDNYRDISVEEYIHLDDFEDVIQECFKESFGFDPTMKSPTEISQRTIENRKKMLEREGLTHYEKYAKPYKERKRKQFPNLSATVVNINGKQKLEELAKLPERPPSILEQMNVIRVK